MSGPVWESVDAQGVFTPAGDLRAEFSHPAGVSGIVVEDVGWAGILPDGSSKVVNAYLVAGDHGTATSNVVFIDDTPDPTKPVSAGSNITSFTLPISQSRTILSSVTTHNYFTYAGVPYDPPVVGHNYWVCSDFSNVDPAWTYIADFSQGVSPALRLYKDSVQHISESHSLTFDASTFAWADGTLSVTSIGTNEFGYITNSGTGAVSRFEHIIDSSVTGYFSNYWSYASYAVLSGVDVREFFTTNIDQTVYGPWTSEFGPYDIEVPQSTDSTGAIGYFGLLMLPYAYKKKPFYTKYSNVTTSTGYWEDTLADRAHHTPYGVINNHLDMFPWIQCSNARHVVQGFGFSPQADPTDAGAIRRFFIDGKDRESDLINAIGAHDLSDVQAVFIDVPLSVIRQLK